MRISTFAATALGTVVARVAAADFWITAESDWFLEGIRFTLHAPQCTKELRTSTLWSVLTDVSGDKTGVRISGDYVTPDVVEWNTPENFLGHHTIYKDRGYKMFDTNDQLVGQCVSDTSYAVNCWYGGIRFPTDYSIFKCTSDTVKLSN